MANRSKQIGTAAETATVQAFKYAGIPAHRVALAGAEDKGDVTLWQGLVTVEVKSGKQTTNPTWKQLRSWLYEATVENENAGGMMPVLVVKRPGSGHANASDWYCYVWHDSIVADAPCPGLFVQMRLADLACVLRELFGAGTVSQDDTEERN